MAVIDWGFVGLHVLISLGGVLMFIALAPYDDDDVAVTKPTQHRDGSLAP